MDFIAGMMDALAFRKFFVKLRENSMTDEELENSETDILWMVSENMSNQLKSGWAQILEETYRGWKKKLIMKTKANRSL